MSKKKPLKSIYKAYNAKRVQIVQIKAQQDSDEHKEITKALAKLQLKWKSDSVREVFVRALLEAAK